jgi:peptidoglycan/LPS O-acetylase OafA/YrhL
VLALIADAAEEGRNVITGMLLVGLVFIAVIALGTTSHYLRERRRRRRRQRPAY